MCACWFLLYKFKYSSYFASQIINPPTRYEPQGQPIKNSVTAWQTKECMPDPTN